MGHRSKPDDPGDIVRHGNDRVGEGVRWDTACRLALSGLLVAVCALRGEGRPVAEMGNAFAAAGGHAVTCFAHVTNAMAVADGDFDEGPADGAEQVLAVISAIAQG